MTHPLAMLRGMHPLLAVLGLTALVLLVALAAAAAASRTAGHAVAVAVGREREQARQERDEAVQRALEHAAVLNREHLGAGLAANRTEVDQVRDDVRHELARLGQLVHQLGQRSAEQLGRVEQSLAAHGEVTTALAGSAQSLREALASPKTRGQWGERMAEDVLRLAGFIEHVNYEKQTMVEGGRGLPDFTFTLPKGHVLFMDVKFPLAAYLRFLDTTNDAERAAHRDTFLRDVRLRVKELSDRDYPRQSSRPAVDYVLLFLPNETISAFIHEQDPHLVDHALTQKVVMCSPLTLFAFLGVIRQAFDNFMIEQTSDEILKLLGTFGAQWTKFTTSLDTVEKRFESVQREFEHLNGARRRQLEKPLQQLEALRQSRGLGGDGELFDAQVYELGA